MRRKRIATIALVAFSFLIHDGPVLSNTSAGQAEFNKGLSLLNGIGIEKDERAALVYFRLAADAGNVQAEDAAGELLSRGTHPSQSRANALQAEMKATVARLRQGHADKADVDRMTLLEKELALVRDPDSALEYFGRAAAAGLAEASRHIGDLLLAGDGVQRDLKQARAEYEVAAEKGDALAAQVLGAMREIGLGGPADFEGAERAYSVAARLGERRAAVASIGLDAARDWQAEQLLLDAISGTKAPPLVRPRLAGTGRRFVVLSEATVSVVDSAGRRRFHGQLRPGAELALADDDASLELVSTKLTLRPDLDPPITFGQLIRPEGKEMVQGRFRMSLRLLPEMRGKKWTVIPQDCDFRVFTADYAFSSPARLVPLQTAPGDIGPLDVPDLPGLFLELRPGCSVDITAPDGTRWTARAPPGVTLRTKLAPGLRKDWQPTVAVPESLPSELGVDAEAGTVVSRDSHGQPDGWALRPDDFKQLGVISPWTLNLAVAALQTSMTRDPAAAVRSVTIFHSANLQSYGGQSTEALSSGIWLARSLANAGRTAEALQQADRWSAVGEGMFGGQHESVAAAHLLRAAIEITTGQLPLAQADARRALVASAMLQPDTPALGDKTAWKNALGTVPVRPGGNVDHRYVNALGLLADLYATAGETARERAVLRRILILETIDDPDGSGNGTIPTLLRISRLWSTEAPASSKALAGYAKRLAKADALLRDVPEPLPLALPPLPPFFRQVFGDPATSMTYANALSELGDAYLLLGQVGDAATVLNAATSIVSRATEPNGPALARMNRLRAEQALANGDVAGALTLARAAFRIDIRTRNESLSVDGSAGLALEAREAADLLLRVFVADRTGSDHIPETFSVLSQVMGGDLGYAVTLSTKPEAAAAAGRLASARRELGEAVTRGDENASTRLRGQVDLLSAQLSSLVPTARGTTLTELQARLGNDGALAVFWPGRTQTFMLAIGPHGRKLAVVERGTEWLRTVAARYRSQLVALNVPFSSEAASSLYTQLFGPVLPELSGAHRLLVIADGFLRSIPLEAFHTPRGWLADNWEVEYLPGFAGATTREHQQSDRPPLFAVANPIVPGGGPGDSPLARLMKWLGEDGLVPLPETVDEVETIRQDLGGDPADLLEGPRATEEQIRLHPDFGSAKVLVFATHGLSAGNGIDPEGLPGLVLSPGKGGKRFLSTAEIERLSVKADLVILSACDTAAPDGSLGSAGLSGLARAFLQAGARAVVATHWRVRTDVAKAFSTALIKAWRTGMTLSAAKDYAQTELRTKDGWGHPGLWASFVLLGEGETRWTPTQ